jgi:hypothetical protein
MSDPFRNWKSAVERLLGASLRPTGAAPVVIVAQRSVFDVVTKHNDGVSKGRGGSANSQRDLFQVRTVRDR